MNTVLLTGWLQSDAWPATQPGTLKQILLFDVWTANDGEPAHWRCEIERTDEQRHAEPKLRAGASVILRAELRARPFVKDQVTKGFVRFLLVDRVEFSRVVLKPETERAQADF